MNELSKGFNDDYKLVIKLTFPFDSGVDIHRCRQSKQWYGPEAWEAFQKRKGNDKFELIRENECTHILYILDIWSEYIYIYRERAKSKDRAKSSCSWKSIARINREDISKRKHFKGKKGITDI